MKRNEFVEYARLAERSHRIGAGKFEDEADFCYNNQ